MVGTLIFGLSCPSLSPDPGHCVVLLWQYTYKYMLLSQCFSSPNKLTRLYTFVMLGGGNPVMD